MDPIVNARGIISFKNGNQYEYEFPLYVVRVQRINDDIVRVFFTDEHRTQIPVPPATVHHDLQTGNQFNDFAGSFFVTWSGRHEIVSAGVVLIQFNNQRQVSVLSVCEHWRVLNPIGVVVRRDGQIVPAAMRLAPHLMAHDVGDGNVAADEEDEEEE
jgi:hypothetical protein